METQPLKREFEYYLAHQGEMVAQYDGKVIVLKNQAVLGVYDNELAAIEETRKHHELGTFLVQKVGPGNAAYTQTFHSRVAFASGHAKF
jgi:hypothetical protein